MLRTYQPPKGKTGRGGWCFLPLLPSTALDRDIKQHLFHSSVVDKRKPMAWPSLSTVSSSTKPLSLVAPPTTSATTPVSSWPLPCRCFVAFPRMFGFERLLYTRSRTPKHVVRMAPEEEKLTRRSPLDFPIEWEKPKPGRRPDIFPQFSPMKTPIPPPLPYDPPGEDEEEEEEDEEKKEEEEGEEEEDPGKEEEPGLPASQ